MPRSPLVVRSRISWGRDTFVVILLACYETLEFWIEYAYLLGMKMSCCPIRASRALLIGLKHIIFEVVVHCLLIAQHAPVLEQELWFVPQVQPCGRTVLKSEMRWSATWWRGTTFCCRRPGINSGDQVVINGVPIGGRARLSIRFVVAGCLTTAWNVVTELLRPRGNSKPIIVVRRSSCSWVGCSSSSSSLVVNSSVLNRNCVPTENFLS
jgi:hypothetical protein